MVLDEFGLHVALLYRRDVFALPLDKDFNKGKGYPAYRQFILWHHKE